MICVGRLRMNFQVDPPMTLVAANEDDFKSRELMAKRKGLSKKIRFEVFKRDKFTCQYCGRKAPEVVLNVDHIDPVAGGGTNEITNLITSCFSCNSGKKDIKLDDDSVVAKQRRQLELLQERREQIELMLEWKKSLDQLDSEVSDMIVSYIESKITPYNLTETSRANIENLIKKFEASTILKAIDIGVEKYLRYSSNGELSQESAETLLDKIGGIAAVQRMSPLKRKLAYIKGIGRNRFNTWDNRKGAIILNNLIKALQAIRPEEEKVIEFLESHVEPMTKTASNWREWVNEIQQFTDTAHGFKSKQETKEEEYNDSPAGLEEIEMLMEDAIHAREGILETLMFFGLAYENFNEKAFEESYYQSIESFLEVVYQFYEEYPNHPRTVEGHINIWEFIRKCEAYAFFNDYDNNLQFNLKNVASHLFYDLFLKFDLPMAESYNRVDFTNFMYLYRKNIDAT